MFIGSGHCSRREFLGRTSLGFGALAFSVLPQLQGRAGQPLKAPLTGIAGSAKVIPGILA